MEKLFLGIKGQLVCLDKASGNKLWATKLKSTSGVTNLLFEDDKVFRFKDGVNVFISFCGVLFNVLTFLKLD